MFRWRVGVMRLLPLAIMAVGCLIPVIDASAQSVDVTPNPGVGAVRDVCVIGGGTNATLIFDDNSASACSGGQTSITGFTFNGAVPASQNVQILGTGITMDTGATLTVGGATTTNGITNTGNIGTGTLSTTGAATLNSATVSTTLGVTGATTTNGITNTGNVGTDTLSTTGLATLDSAAVTNNATVGGTLDVTDATTLQSTLVVNGLATFNGGVAVPGPVVVGGALDVTGPTTLQSTLDVTGQANLNGGAVVTGNTTTDTLTVNNGATVGGPLSVAGQANLNGGANVSKHLTVAPATTVNMGGNRVQNVGTPIAVTDAATKGYVDQQVSNFGAQMNKRIDQNAEGIAVAMSMSGLALPDNKNFAMAGNIGYYDNKQALSAQAAVRLNRTLALMGGIGVGMDQGSVGGRVGMMAAW